METTVEKKEKNMKNINRLAMRIFGVNWFSGRITHNKRSLNVWSKGLVPRVAVRIYPEYNIINVKIRNYEPKAHDFERDYKKEFLQPEEEITFSTSYDSGLNLFELFG